MPDGDRGQNPAGGNGQSEGPRHGLAKRIGGLIAALAGIAGIIGLVVTLVDRPEPWTKADWVSEANAVCEREIGTLSSATLNSRSSLSAMQTSLRAGTLTDQQIKNAAWYFDAAAGALRSINGEIRSIERPESIKGDVDKVVDGGVGASNAMSRVAGDLSQVSLANPTQSLRVLNAADSEIKKVDPLLSQWQEGLVALGVTSCNT
ncbi:hypothetical protein JK359_28765 [Streptomyces actinomycinicus]|uniref:Uncharacterized protein n=1 Tax=Streptomyces actinomycinicus TaxID=1695166 RepID=A0A937ENY7_9ACTN|nr:hypothetical protein [Streptomyces actinomycinicus]MBL1085913.1 hypothetical protein [Streptomyces actinomycinicus]